MSNIISTDQVAGDTNNLQANIIDSGSISIASGDWTSTGATFGASPARTGYYMNKSTTLKKVKANQIPFVFAWYTQTGGSSYIALNYYADWENPYVQWARWWYTLTSTTFNGQSVLSLNVYAIEQAGAFENGVTVYYRVVSGGPTEVSGL